MTPTVPPQGPYRIVDARLPCGLVDGATAADADADGLCRADLLIDDGRIARIDIGRRGLGDAATLPAVDLAGGMVWPTCSDLHTHLDNAVTWSRAPNPTGSWLDALKVVERDRETYWNVDDLVRRMDFALRCAWAHGTSGLRTHLDSLEVQREISWAAFAQVRERWAGRVALQGVALVLPFRYAGAGGVELADLVARHGGLLGGIIVDEADPAPAVERIFELACERDLDVDLHVDESSDPRSNGLDAVVDATLRHGWEGRVTVGHCCSLALREPDAAARTIERVARAGITVVSLPMCNLYLQDRRTGASTPRWRGIPPIQELDAAGVPVALASDDSRDAYYPFGDLDPVEVFVQSVRIAQLDHRMSHWVRAVTAVPARAMGVPGGGRLAEGVTADLILFDARNGWELGARAAGHRTVLRAGRALGAAPPDFRELDGPPG